jgi:hypothetical protein
MTSATPRRRSSRSGCAGAIVGDFSVASELMIKKFLHQKIVSLDYRLAANA